MRKTNHEREIFNMVYQWGKVGILTDESCPAFEDLMKAHDTQIREDLLEETTKDLIETFSICKKLGRSDMKIEEIKLVIKEQVASKYGIKI
jgi:hypothetical protein